jgi:hypothetical protein
VAAADASRWAAILVFAITRLLGGIAMLQCLKD